MIDGLKPYPAFKDSGVRWLGQVPEHWQVRRLRHTADMRVSNVDKHTKAGEFPVRLCNYVDVYKNDRITDRVSFMNATASPGEIERFRVKRGDVLVTKDSEAWDDIGVPALIEYAADDLLCGYHLAQLRPFEGIDGGFLFRVLQSKLASYQFHVEANGVTRYGLSHAAIKSVWLPIASLPEQTAIIRFLDCADRRMLRYIRAKQSLIKLLDEKRQVIIQRAVTRGIDPNIRLAPSKVEWLGDVPEHWQIKRAKYLFREIDHRFVNGSEELLSLRMYRGLVPHKEVSTVPVSDQALVGYKKVLPGQIVMNRMRAAIGMFGVAHQPGLVSPDYAVLAGNELVDVDYFLNLFKTPAARTVFRLESKGLGTGSSGFMRLYSDRFGTIKLPVPPKGEQGLIVQNIKAETEEIDRAANRLNREIHLLREYRTRIIADIVTGKLDVRAAGEQLSDVGGPAEETDVIEEEEEAALAEAANG
jgi:type I restriction enzyme S subunit